MLPSKQIEYLGPKPVMRVPGGPSPARQARSLARLLLYRKRATSRNDE